MKCKLKMNESWNSKRKRKDGTVIDLSLRSLPNGSTVTCRVNRSCLLAPGLLAHPLVFSGTLMMENADAIIADRPEGNEFGSGLDIHSINPLATTADRF